MIYRQITVKLEFPRRAGPGAATISRIRPSRALGPAVWAAPAPAAGQNTMLSERPSLLLVGELPLSGEGGVGLPGRAVRVVVGGGRRGGARRGGPGRGRAGRGGAGVGGAGGRRGRGGGTGAGGGRRRLWEGRPRFPAGCPAWASLPFVPCGFPLSPTAVVSFDIIRRGARWPRLLSRSCVPGLGSPSRSGRVVRASRGVRLYTLGARGLRRSTV